MTPRTLFTWLARAEVVTWTLWVDQRWRLRQVVAVLAAGVVPFATLWVERWVARAHLVTGHWRLSPQGDAARTAPERVVAAVLARPGATVLVAAAVVGVTTLALLVVGPPPVPGQGA